MSVELGFKAPSSPFLLPHPALSSPHLYLQSITLLPTGNLLLVYCPFHYMETCFIIFLFQSHVGVISYLSLGMQ